MKQLPTVDMSYRPLHDLAMGPQKAAFLDFAINSKIFDELRDFTSSEKVARNLSFHKDNTRRFMNALATLDLVEKKQSLFRNLPLAQRFLVSDSPTYIGKLLLQSQNTEFACLDKVEALIKQGPMAQEESRDLSSPELWAEEVKSSAGWVLGGAGQIVSQVVSSLPGFDCFDSMLEMGCGHGVFSFYIMEKNPKLIGHLLDRKEVLEATRFFVDSFEVNDRVAFLPGDYINGELNGPYDLIFASATLNFAVDCLDDLFVKVHKALKPGGYFISFQDGMTHEQTKPDTMLGAVIPSMMMGFDYCFDQGRIADSMVNCGFKSVRSRTLSTSIGDMELDIARKAE